MEIKELNEEQKVETYVPDADDKIIQEFVKNRVKEMQDYRSSLKIEEKWKEADREYVPSELDFGTTNKRFETDQTDGYRTRLVPIGDGTQNWRSSTSAPTLLQKIQTAISLIVENDPEAVFTALKRKYESTNSLANSLWKRNWQVTDGKQVLKLFMFNLIKYGFAFGRTYPRIIKYNKQVLVEYDDENPEKNKYEDKELVWFNDVARQNLDPYRTWIDENTKPYDIYSMNDDYFELDYSYDEAKIEFGDYPNFKYVKKDSKSYPDDEMKEIDDDKKVRKDIVTIGFYENRLKDLFVIKAVKDDIILHACPLPNDDGFLSLWHTMWILRSADRPDGISLWEIICQDKQTYDKWNNMGSDQLALSIMKFGYYTGTQALSGDGKMEIVPGMAKQITGGEVKWMEIPGPGADWVAGLEKQQANMDDSSGITPTLEGDITGKTLGEIQLAKESSLKRLKVPLENISWAIEQDAYLSLSWMSQVYSTPEVRSFASEKEMMDYENENDITHDEMFMEYDQPEEINPETGLPIERTPVGMKATYYPQLALHLEDRNGQLYESAESKYFQIGKDIPLDSMKWRGMIKVIPKSLVGNSEMILKQTKMELFNLIVPLLSQPPELVKKSVMQILKVNEEDPEDWLPDLPGWNDEIPYPPAPMSNELFVPQQGGAGQTPGQPQSVVPQSDISTPQTKSIAGDLGGLFRQNG